MASVPPPVNQPAVPAAPFLPPVIRNEDIKTDLQDPTKHHVTVNYNNKSYKVTVFGGQNEEQIKNFALELIALAVTYNVGGKNKKLTVTKSHDQQGGEQISVSRNRNAADGTPKAVDSGTTIKDIIHIKEARIQAKISGAPADPARQQKLNEKLTAQITKGLEIFDSIYPPPMTRVRATPINDQEEEEENELDSEGVEATLIPNQVDSRSSSSTDSDMAQLKEKMRQASLPPLAATQEEVLKKMHQNNSSSANQGLSDEEVRKIESLAVPLMNQEDIVLQRVGADIFFVHLRSKLDQTDLLPEFKRDVETAFDAYIKDIVSEKEAKVLKDLINTSVRNPDDLALKYLADGARALLRPNDPSAPPKTPSLENRDDLRGGFEAEIHSQ